jgi:hypothetical protein
MGWGQLLGGAAGFFIGGPAGAALGATLGGAAEEATGGGASGAAREAAQISNAAGERDLALRTRMYEEGVARQQPFYQAGVNALPQYVSGIQKGGELVRGFTPADFTTDPGYGFRLKEGQKALDRQAAARSGLISGGALKAATRFGQEMGSLEYTNAYNRFRDTQGLRRNALAGVAGYGPTAAGAINAAGQNYATGAGNIMSGQGDTSANALLAAQQARSSSYGQLGSALSKYLNPKPSYNYGGFGGGSASFGEGEY